MPARPRRLSSIAAVVAAIVLVSVTCGKDATGPDGREGAAGVSLNVAPVASAGGPYTGTEGVAITFDASGSSDTEGGALSYVWDFDGDGTADLTTASTSATHVYPDDGAFTATLTVTDDSSVTSSASASVSIANDPPAVSVPATATATAGSSFALTGTVADKGAADGPWAVTYDWGDGNTTPASLADLAAGLSASHTYARAGTFTVTATVTDKDGGVGSGQLTLTVNAAPLVVGTGGPYTGTEGTAVTFDGSGSSDPDGDPVTLTWNFGDGSATATGTSPSHTYAQNGSYTVTLTVSDGNGSTNSATTTATISNALPVVNAGADAAIDEGQSFSLSASFTDKGAADNPWGYTVNWGDGSGNATGSLATQAAITGTHTYNTPGSYNVTVTVTDKDGGGSNDVAVVTVRAVKPTARPGTSYSGTEGTAIAFDGSASSDPNGDALTYSWNWGDNTTAGTGATPSHTYVQNGNYTVTLTVNDGNGHTGTATAPVTVTNANPVVNPLANAAIDEGQSFTLNGSFADKGTADNPWGYTIVWGDASANTTGSVSTQTAITGSHTYNTPGTYTVTLTVKDKDNGSGSASLTLTVRAVKPAARTGGPYTGTEGTAVSFNGSTSSDPNGDVLAYSWNWGDNTTAGTGATPTHVYKDNGTYTAQSGSPTASPPTARPAPTWPGRRSARCCPAPPWPCSWSSASGSSSPAASPPPSRAWSAGCAGSGTATCPPSRSTGPPTSSATWGAPSRRRRPRCGAPSSR
jgi:PKD repeat protein